MKFRFFIDCMLAAALSIGCSRVSEPLESDAFEFKLEATMGELTPGVDELTKANMMPVIRLTWKQDDEVNAINLTTGKILGGSLKADRSGTTTTFSGSLTGTVNPGDRVAFLYPRQEYNSTEVDFHPLYVDFSSQVGTSTDGAPLCVYSVVSAGSNCFDSAEATFSFLMSFIQMSFGNLERGASIREVSISNIGSGITVEASSTDLSAVPTVGTIALTPPSSYKTNATGNKSVYLTISSSPAVSNRDVTVKTENYKHSMSWVTSALKQNTSYTSTLSDFAITALNNSPVGSLEGITEEEW